MSEPTQPKKPRPRVFISYARADSEAAKKLVDALRNAALHVWDSSWELAPGDRIAPRIEQAVGSSDLLIVLLSPQSVGSHWVKSELSLALSKELKERAITVIPTMIERCVIPQSFADRGYFDLTHDFSAGVQHLVDRLASAPDIDFSKLDSSRFESLIADLLQKLGFTVQRTPLSRDSGFDFVVSYKSRDPFGAEEIEKWLVEAKFYQKERVSISALQQMLGYLITAPGVKRGLVVTNSQLTSVAHQFLLDYSERSGPLLRVVDGTELTNLLIQHPGLVRTYFLQSDQNE